MEKRKTQWSSTVQGNCECECGPSAAPMPTQGAFEERRNKPEKVISSPDGYPSRLVSSEDGQMEVGDLCNLNSGDKVGLLPLFTRTT